MKLTPRLLFLALLLFAVPACSSGGGGGGGNAQVESDWDSLVWDAGEWA